VDITPHSAYTVADNSLNYCLNQNKNTSVSVLAVLSKCRLCDSSQLTNLDIYLLQIIHVSEKLIALKI